MGVYGIGDDEGMNGKRRNDVKTLLLTRYCT